MSIQLWPSLYTERLPPTHLTPMPSGAEDHSVQQWVSGSQLPELLSPKTLMEEAEEV